MTIRRRHKNLEVATVCEFLTCLLGIWCDFTYASLSLNEIHFCLCFVFVLYL